MTGIEISASQVRRLAHEVGTELIDQRDRRAIDHRRRQLPPRTEVIPEAVVVEIDRGRIRTRAAGSAAGVHDAKNKEDKIACLVTLNGPTFAADPCPEVPESFLCPRRVQRLVSQMKGQAGEADPQEIPEGQADHQVERVGVGCRQTPGAVSSARTTIISEEGYRVSGGRPSRTRISSASAGVM
jgi:hypothetical protein